jgi:hypothetical protein
MNLILWILLFFLLLWLVNVGAFWPIIILVGIFSLIYFINLYLSDKKYKEEHLSKVTSYKEKLFNNIEKFNKKYLLNIENDDEYQENMFEFELPRVKKIAAQNIMIFKDQLITFPSMSFFKKEIDDYTGVYSEIVDEISKTNKIELFERVIPLNDIVHFKVEGSKRYENKISGGGSSISGAIIGDAIAGDVGAIVGSRKAVKSKEIVHDERLIVLVYYKNSKLVKEKLTYSDELIEFFENNLLDKDFNLLGVNKPKKNK